MMCSALEKEVTTNDDRRAHPLLIKTLADELHIQRTIPNNKSEKSFTQTTRTRKKTKLIIEENTIRELK
jgi:hypothetical protein